MRQIKVGQISEWVPGEGKKIQNIFVGAADITSINEHNGGLTIACTGGVVGVPHSQRDGSLPSILMQIYNAQDSQGLHAIKVTAVKTCDENGHPRTTRIQGTAAEVLARTVRLG